MVLWYGNSLLINNKNKMLKNVKNSKYNQKFHYLFNKRVTNCINTVTISVKVPTAWNFVLINSIANNPRLHIYSSVYFINIFVTSYVKLYIDKCSRTFVILFTWTSSFFRLYWNTFNAVFSSILIFFFKKFKFKGRGYHVYKNYRNTLTFQFGHSHRIYTFNFFSFFKKINNLTFLFFGLNKNDLNKCSFSFYYVKPRNIFTGKGIRFAKQIIYKKTGKISSYR